MQMTLPSVCSIHSGIFSLYVRKPGSPPLKYRWQPLERSLRGPEGKAPLSAPLEDSSRASLLPLLFKAFSIPWQTSLTLLSSHCADSEVRCLRCLHFCIKYMVIKFPMFTKLFHNFTNEMWIPEYYSKWGHKTMDFRPPLYLVLI